MGEPFGTPRGRSKSSEGSHQADFNRTTAMGKIRKDWSLGNLSCELDLTNLASLQTHQNSYFFL